MLSAVLMFMHSADAFEDIALQLTSKLTISYVEGNHQLDSVRGDRDREQAQREVQGRRCSLKSWGFIEGRQGHPTSVEQHVKRVWIVLNVV